MEFNVKYKYTNIIIKDQEKNNTSLHSNNYVTYKYIFIIKKKN